MDSLRITLLVIGVVFIALVYAWERRKRSKDETRYARWGGVADDDTESHIAGRNSGDLETDSRLIDTAYDSYPRDDESEPVEPEFINEPFDEAINESIDEPINEPSDVNDDWRSEVEASLAKETQLQQSAVYDDDDELDLDTDPELQVAPLEDITSELEALEEIISADHEPDQIEMGDLDMPVVDTDAEVSSEPDRIIAVHVLAREGSVFTGPDILNSLTHLGMQYGDMNVFHCMGTNNKSVFSLINAVEPGIFDLSEMDDMTTPALLLMMSLPNPLPALEAFDGMLEVARSLTTSLDGRLCDETRSVLTRQAIDELRAELASL